jgi:molecular chaperone HtpG
MSTATLIGISKVDPQWQSHVGTVVVGKDIMELLSSSMYVDPMSIFREYTQNSSDSIEDAVTSGILRSSRAGRVDITIDPTSRSIRIRDNGTGISENEFFKRLTAFGASAKRDSNARGFRGVGRLAGLGYCQELIFRSRTLGEANVCELKWDGKKIKQALKTPGFHGHLSELVNHAVTFRKVEAKGFPEHFFEVELQNVIRHKNDILLNSEVITAYLAQVAPVPFSPEFPFAERINNALSPHVSMCDFKIQIHGVEGQIYRSHRDICEMGNNIVSRYSDLELFELPAVDGSIAAVGWILHHDYLGAVPERSGVRGLRLRVGNIQVGDGSLLADLFPEPRFNSWTVGEIHIVDRRITPNGRRDHFEQNVHYYNLLNHLSPITRQIASRCRVSSIRRNALREFDRLFTSLQHDVSIIRQGAVTRNQKQELLDQCERTLEEIGRVAARTAVKDSSAELQKRIDKARGLVSKVATDCHRNRSLASVSPAKRRAYEEIVDLIYRCSPSKDAAKLLVDKILSSLGKV